MTDVSTTPEPVEPDHPAVRLGDLDLSRATEQTAILMALWTAHELGRKHRQRGHRFALPCMLGYLSHAFYRGAVLHRSRDYTESSMDYVWDSLRRTVSQDGQMPEHPEALFGERFADAAATAPAAPWDLELVVTPIDGMRVLLAGMNTGTISVLAGGPRGSFLREDDHNLCDDYLLLALNPVFVEACGAGFRSNLDDLHREYQTRTGQDRTDKERTDLLEELLTRVLELIKSHTRRLPLLAFATATNYPDFVHSTVRKVLRHHFRTSAFEGSSVAAGLLAFFPAYSVGGFLGIVRRTHAFLLAVAAQATESKLYAIPVRRLMKEARKKAGSVVLDKQGAPKQESTEDFVLMDTGKMYSEADLLPGVASGNDVFLVATGVTENVLLRGVRFQSETRVSTSTLCLRSQSRACRWIDHVHDLRVRRFRFIDKDDHELMEALSKFEERGIKLTALFRD